MHTNLWVDSSNSQLHIFSYYKYKAKMKASEKLLNRFFYLHLRLTL